MDWATALGHVDTDTPLHIIIIRLLIATVFGAAIGWERETQHGQAGLRTHILIAVAATLFTSLAFEIFHLVEIGGPQSRADPIRAVEAVTAGIAFLGAGAIFQQRGSVRGLTTGAGMWLAGAVGITVALGHYLLALGATILAVLVLSALRAFTHRKPEADKPKA